MAKAQKGAHTGGACRVVTNMGEDAVGCADCDAEDDKQTPSAVCMKIARGRLSCW